MVDRVLVYPTETPSVEDILLPNKNMMLGIGKLAEAIIGKTTAVRGLLCVPTIPTSMSVTVGEGDIYSYENVDNTAYGTIPLDNTHQVLKQGIRLNASDFECPAPSTSGYSINYLIQAAFQELDNKTETRPFYNADNPDEPYYNSVTGSRECHCNVSVKAGVAAPTGTQVTPAPDSGAVGLWVVTVAAGQIKIIDTDITQYPQAPFIEPKRYLFYTAIDRDGSNNYTGSVSPSITAYQDGMTIVCKVIQANTGDATVSLNGLPAHHVKDLRGNLLVANDFLANQVCILVYNNGTWVAQFWSTNSVVVSDFTGDHKFTDATGERAGWIWVHDSTKTTIGNVGSSAANSIRASADCYNLYKLYWDHFAETECPMDGGPRGSSADIDWAANRRIFIPAKHRRVFAAHDIVDTLRIGQPEGGKTVTLTGAQNGQHAHAVGDNGHVHTCPQRAGGAGGGGGGWDAGTGAQTNTGWAAVVMNNSPETATQPHNNMQPTNYLNLYIKL